MSLFNTEELKVKYSKMSNKEIDEEIEFIHFKLDKMYETCTKDTSENYYNVAEVVLKLAVIYGVKEDREEYAND